ncbi:hypothetical protein ACWET9_42875 [Streptomyces sp. NPDC004059]
MHLDLAESPAEGRRAWLDVLDTISALEPEAVVAGHKNPVRPDDPARNRRDAALHPGFEAVAERTTTTVDLYRGMLELHPDRVNQGALWGSATSAKG